MLSFKPLVFDKAEKNTFGLIKNQMLETLLYTQRTKRAEIDDKQQSLLDSLESKLNNYVSKKTFEIDITDSIQPYLIARPTYVQSLDIKLPRIENDVIIKFFLDNLSELYKGKTLYYNITENNIMVQTYFHFSEYQTFSQDKLDNMYMIIEWLNIKLFPYRNINKYEYINQQINNHMGEIINIWENYIPYIYFINLMYKNLALYDDIYQRIVNTIFPNIDIITQSVGEFFDNRNDLESKIDILLSKPEVIVSFKELVKYARDNLDEFLRHSTQVNLELNNKLDNIQTIDTNAIYLSEEMYPLGGTKAFLFYENNKDRNEALILNNDQDAIRFRNDTLITKEQYEQLRLQITDLSNECLKMAYKLFINNGDICLREIGYYFNNIILY